MLILNCAIRFFTIDILWVFIGLENLKIQSYCFAIWHNAYASLFSLHLGHSIFQKCESSHFFFIFFLNEKVPYLGKLSKKKNDETYGKFHILEGGGSARGHFPYVITILLKCIKSHFKPF